MHPLLRSFFPIADTIAGAFGRRCEVSVHDLTQNGYPAVYRTGNAITGSRDGKKKEQLLQNLLASDCFQDDHAVNYLRDNPAGVPLRSSASLIRDEKGEVIGMLCIHIDTTLETMLLAESMQFSPAISAAPCAEPQSIPAATEQLIHRIIGYADVKNLSRKEGVALVKRMDEQGVFLVKGAIDRVAERMGISRVSIYSYLDIAKGKR